MFWKYHNGLKNWNSILFIKLNIDQLNIKLEYYKTQRTVCYSAHDYLQYMCTVMTG